MVKKYAVTYIPSKNGFAVTELKKGMTIKKQYQRNTSIVNASTPNQAIKRLSESTLLS